MMAAIISSWSGRVLKAIFEPRRDPLLYFRGRYRKLHFA